ncbi:MAG: glutamate racemase [Candidatus Omnitrophica bacterium]|nr:glutamate racemase [Candidatus Omnitrophota bacterium]MBU4487687.1 glutamate racemase [Candidatus Omnitrophota bacterium]MCG2704814.1 glutamate racemase [Candidatus Omnitrophota bacterium]
MHDKPIGIFDSGIGGLTVLKEIRNILPREDIVYFGDTARVPYGTKSKETVIKFSLQDADFLSNFDVKMIVVACNTASSLSLDMLKRRYDIPLVGVIEPGARKAASLTRKMKIGVIGTKATVKSGIYEREVKKFNPAINVLSTDCPLFVPLVEEGWLHGKITEAIAKTYLAPVKKFGADVLVLGCTHYPLLKSVIQKALGRGVKLVDSAKETAKEVKAIIEENGMAKRSNENPEYAFYVSDEPALFKKIGEKFLKRPIERIEKAEIELKEKYVHDRSISQFQRST